MTESFLPKRIDQILDEDAYELLDVGEQDFERVISKLPVFEVRQLNLC